LVPLLVIVMVAPAAPPAPETVIVVVGMAASRNLGEHGTSRSRAYVLLHFLVKVLLESK